MKATFLTFLAMLSAPAGAVEWLVYHSNPEQAITLYYDLDSLHQTLDAFEAEIRMPVNDGKQEILAHLVVDCGAKSYRLQNGRLLTGGKSEPAALEEAVEPIGNSSISSLEKKYCAHWQEPESVRWQEFAASPGQAYFYDEPFGREKRTCDKFVAQVRILGDATSYLGNLNVSSTENSYTLTSMVKRDEKSGLVSNKASEGPLPIEPSSWVAILKSLYCTTDPAVANPHGTSNP
jgi:hypothetical protein